MRSPFQAIESMNAGKNGSTIFATLISLDSLETTGYFRNLRGDGGHSGKCLGKSDYEFCTYFCIAIL